MRFSKVVSLHHDGPRCCRSIRMSHEKRKGFNPIKCGSVTNTSDFRPSNKSNEIKKLKGRPVSLGSTTQHSNTEGNQCCELATKSEEDHE